VKLNIVLLRYKVKKCGFNNLPFCVVITKQVGAGLESPP
jgi:hypothetical protein